MEELIRLLNEKIQLLERYEQATLRLVYEDIYSFGDILNDRQILVPLYENVNNSIGKVVAAQPENIRPELEAIVSGKSESEIAPEAAMLIGKINTLHTSINKNDKLAFSRVKKEREDIVEKIESTQKSEQVIKYVSASTYDVSRGAKFNQKM